ncbi:MAG: hypothetical protein ABSA74_01995 [Candidatus Staskawiczbacteria bacterium]|jgi:hypothetical protein
MMKFENLPSGTMFVEIVDGLTVLRIKTEEERAEIVVFEPSGITTDKMPKIMPQDTRVQPVGIIGIEECFTFTKFSEVESLVCFVLLSKSSNCVCPILFKGRRGAVYYGPRMRYKSSKRYPHPIDPDAPVQMLALCGSASQKLKSSH